MGHIIPFGGDEHRRVELTLPWYLNGTLEAEEQARVEAHLADCAECREALELERRIAETVADHPSDADLGWARLRNRIDSRTAGPRRARLKPRARWVWGAIAAQLLVAVALISVRIATPPPPQYQTLGSPPSQVAGNLIVAFRPDASEAEMRRILGAVHARLVDGPTDAGAYVLRVRGPDRTQALERLRREDAVTLAQQLDAPRP